MAQPQLDTEDDTRSSERHTDARASLAPASDWGSFVGDLSKRGDRPAWRVHDRTHVEFALDYAIEPGARSTEHEWEAYFFVPESLRIDSKTYDKQDIYSDLASYIRFAVPDVPFAEVAGAPLERLRDVVESGDRAAMIRELRVFACLVRAAGVARKRTISDALNDGDSDRRTRALAATSRMVADTGRIAEGLRSVLATLPEGDDTLTTAAQWVDEDVSRLLETLMGNLAIQLEEADAPETLRQSVVNAAVSEARYRRDGCLEGVGTATASKRDVEHLEFRRHVLKRFTSSVLWLKPEVRDAARVVLNVLYAVAAGVAMTFAVVAAIWNGNPMGSDLFMWAVIAVLAYMAKDRLKAWLQGVFSSVVSRHLPDRRWRLHDPERRVMLGKIDEQSAFVPFGDLPPAVLERRRSTRVHPLEEQARVEKVLWHRKVVRLSAAKLARADERFDALTEIFRLDLRRWLAHTDDPKRKIVFADPEAGRVQSAIAPRVYNLGIVYRLRRAGDDSAPWERIRVVVTRKGIRRIDHIPGTVRPAGLGADFSLSGAPA
ncbi:MAG: hypothetical protein H6719_04695 [Sandaracinaceae bacterium]|nr:hypothetical protein [Sandaracinaceae bacterium]